MDAGELITSWDVLGALRSDWERLWRDAGDAYLSQSFAWCETRWQTLQAQPGHQLACVVMRDAGRVTLIWPFVVRREALWRIARPLEQATTEYSAALTEKAGADARVAEAWRFARANVPCDLFILKATPQASPLDAVLRESEPRATLEIAPRRFVSFAAFADWDAYYLSVKNDKRRGLQRRIRRLEETGTITVAPVRDAAERAEAADWIFRTKAKWLQDQEEAAVWSRVAGYDAFLKALPADDGAGGGLSITLLKLDGKTLAGEIARVDNVRVEPFVSTFDPDFAKFSPGEILCMYCIKAAQARGREYDFRIGDDMYKSYWANGRSELHSYKIARTPMGALGDAAVKFRENLRRQVSKKPPIAEDAAD